MAKVRDIIKPQMTVLWFMHSKGVSEAYFQNTCFEASSIAFGYADYGEHHPYSFMEMKEWRDDLLPPKKKHKCKILKFTFK